MKKTPPKSSSPRDKVRVNPAAPKKSDARPAHKPSSTQGGAGEKIERKPPAAREKASAQPPKKREAVERTKPRLPTQPVATRKKKVRLEGPPRSGSVAIVGVPNVGKSTLLNAILGEHFAIATPKPGTTRNVLLGVYRHAHGALSFYDTPGLDRPRDMLHRALLEEAQGALDNVDVIALVVDATTCVRKGDLSAEDKAILPLIERADRKLVLVLNKVDRIRDKARLLPLLQVLHASQKFADLVPVSAAYGDGLDALVATLHRAVPEGADGDPQTFTNRSERFFVAEFVREAVFQLTHDEVPYGVAVHVDEWVNEGPRTRITCSIVLERDGHKGIVIGRGGSMLRTIGESARANIETFLKRKVHLQTFVKVIPGWTQRAEFVQQLTREGTPLS